MRKKLQTQIIMDNATFHKSKRTQELIEKAECKLIFLPPYSRDLNPIEKYWGWFKAQVRSMIHQFSILSQTIDHVFNM
ncbi:MAG: transposase [Parachlamydiaceae bacterium]